ncbi:hypothetical protein CTEN210_00189 [Chaetoceros tenuissimus]|uniref:HYR domain-containing protein n=1 Tax=Chaetoceros tenuissimus TaxID=426638 RepID=A0AAD3CF95_9STRA|nr:hypothetical protein CTEN210_00189 [Chaetoceros tenuissimus]
MKLNCFLFLVGLTLPAASALSSFPKNNEDDAISRSSPISESSLQTAKDDVASSDVYTGGAVGNDGNLNLRGERVLQGCAAGESDVVVTIDADRYPGETSWKIFNAGTSTAVASVGTYSLTHDGVHTWSNCLPAGDYTFTIYDRYGDGFCLCSRCEGFFKVSVDGVEKFKVNGYNFGFFVSRDFTVSPNSDPNAICQNVSVDADNTCQASVEASAFNNGSTDVDGDNLSFSVDQSGSYDLGTTEVTLTVSDGTASNTCTAQLTVTDNTAPTVTCNDFSIAVSSGSGTLTIADIKGNASDNCGVDSEEIEGSVSFTCDDVGNTRDVTLKVQDAAGKSNTCTSKVTAINALPEVNAGGVYNILLAAGITAGNGQLSGTATDSDDSTLTYAWSTNCPGATITNGNSLKADISIASGTNPTTCSVTLAVTDACGAIVQDTASVSVVYQNSPPNAICQNVSIDADDTSQATVAASAFNNGSTDDDSDALSFSATPAGPYDLGTTDVTLTVSDGIATDTCSAQVTVLTPPTLFSSNDLKITFSGIPASIDETDLADLIADLETITKDSIPDALLAEGIAIDANSITITSTVVSNSSRKLRAIDSARFLQGTLDVEQDVNVNAPATAVNSGTITTNINDGISSSSNDILQTQNVSSQASIVYEEPPWPCNGITCSNAGKCEVLSHTEAICRCENTFVPSESGLECICPDGLNFHANVNRCLPPPTAAPSDLPSAFASLTPSSIPSDGKIDKEDTPSCIDDMSGTFQLFNIMEEVECDWLTRNKDKTTYRKNKYCVMDEVKSLCQSTCGACTGCDDKEGTFTLLNVKKRETCAWLTKNKLNAEKRKDAYCVLDEVRDMCKASCGACAIEDESGRV